jgi:hypothetical protein
VQAFPIGGISGKQTREQLVDSIVANARAKHESLKGVQPFGEQVGRAKLREKLTSNQLCVVPHRSRFNLLLDPVNPLLMVAHATSCSRSTCWSIFISPIE